jgi:hypothetical protein
MSCFAMAAAGCRRRANDRNKHAKIGKPCLAAGNRQEMEIKMKTSTKQAKNFRPTLSKIVIALAVASVMGGASMTPAFGQDRERRDNRRDNGWRHNDNRHDDRYWREHQRVYRPVYRHPYYYSQPVYAPPPVYYPPQPSPGFSLFFPLDVRR